MRAVVCHELAAPSALSVHEWPSPEAGPGQVVVSIRAAGMNFPDALQVQGLHQYKLAPPFIPGGELAGVIKAVGAGVSSLQPGQRVMATRLRGAYAEEIALPARQVHPLPDNVPFEQAAVLGVTYFTAYCGLVTQGQLQAGETVLVLGASGGVGLAAIEVAKARGARVIAAASSDAKLAVCAENGADELINYATQDLRQRTKEIAGDKGVDLVFDPVGGHYAEPALRSLGWRGRYLVVGFAHGEIPRVPLNLALLKSASIIGVFLGDLAKREPVLYASIERDVIDLAGRGLIRPYVSRRYKLEQAGEALQAMLNREAVGKFVLVP